MSSYLDLLPIQAKIASNDRIHACRSLREPFRFLQNTLSDLVLTPRASIEILATILNDGLSPITSNRILQRSTIDAMFTNTVPSYHTKYAHRGLPVSRPDLAWPALSADFPVTENQGWGLNFLLLGDNLQRATAPGLSNCFWGLDREKGVGGVVLSQILPFGDPVIFPLWVKLQEGMYNNHALETELGAKI